MLLTLLPQLDSPTSVCVKRRPEQEFVQRTTTIPRGGYPDESDSNSHNNRRPHDEQDTLEGGDVIMIEVERPPDRGNDQERGYSRRRGSSDDRGPPDNGGPPGNGRNLRHP